MSTKFFIAVFVGTMAVASAGVCFARLGETEAQLEARYGKPLPPGLLGKSSDVPPEGKELFWLSEDATLIKVCSLRGRCIRQQYFLLNLQDGGKPKLHLPLKENMEHVEDWLKQNAQGATWKEGRPAAFADVDFEMAWVRSDGKAFAYVRNDSLTIDDLELLLQGGFSREKR